MKFKSFCPKCFSDYPAFLQELYGLLIMLSDAVYSHFGRFKYDKGCSASVATLAKCLHWNVKFTRRCLGVLWKMSVIEYRDEKFFCVKH